MNRKERNLLKKLRTHFGKRVRALVCSIRCFEHLVVSNRSGLFSGIGLFHRRYASSLRFTCIYSMESGRFAFGEGALTRETWFLHVKRALYFWKGDCANEKYPLSQSSRKGLLNGSEFST